MRTEYISFALACVAAAALAGCSTQAKLSRLRKDAPSAHIAMARERELPATLPSDVPQQDTLIIKNVDGRDMILMRAIKDDDGGMVANQVLEAAHVTARFRNVAERHGKVDLEFQVIVPPGLQDSRWQIRYSPVMYILKDTVLLDKVIITGRDYRKRQLRGYQQYQRFLSRIISDSTRFIHIDALEIFLSRNLPQIYAFRCDSSFVSDEAFESVFGVTEREAIDHYTDKLAWRMNDLRIARKERMYRKYVKAPIITEGIRLDTVMTDSDGYYVYNYIQTVNTAPGLRKADIFLTGELFEQDRKLCDIGNSDILNFYISSLSAFVDERERYLTRIIERNVEAFSSYNISFPSGGSDINPRLGENAGQLAEIRGNLRQLMCSRQFELDSVIVTASASPEGAFASNGLLSQKRGKSVISYFDRYMQHLTDSLSAEAGAIFNLDEEYMEDMEKIPHIIFTNRHMAENWNGLDNLVETDSVMTRAAKDSYLSYRTVKDPDLREAGMRKEKWYPYVRTELYPMLRKVNFHFHLHRKGMVKDTVMTTILDSTYMAGVQAIKDRDYEKALELLMPYGDYNAAVACCALDRNLNALGILENCEKTAQVNYMLALLYSRQGDDRNAVQHYLDSCTQNPQYVHRGNLDPEISRLIKTYRLDEQMEQYQP